MLLTMVYTAVCMTVENVVETGTVNSHTNSYLIYSYHLQMEDGVLSLLINYRGK